jgi:hypothetical protein
MTKDTSDVVARLARWSKQLKGRSGASGARSYTDRMAVDDADAAVAMSDALALISSLVAERVQQPQFEGLPKRKLDDLLARGWEISGYAIHKDGEHGLVTTGGFVGWFTTAQNNASEAERLLAEARAERDELQQLFDLRWAASMRAIKRWQEANPGNDLVWPDSADLDVWALEQADAATDRLTDALVALKPFADYAPYVSMFVEGRAAQGGSPILPTKHFRRADFERAAAVLASIGGGNG